MALNQPATRRRGRKRKGNLERPCVCGMYYHKTTRSKKCVHNERHPSYVPLRQAHDKNSEVEINEEENIELCQFIDEENNYDAD